MRRALATRRAGLGIALAALLAVLVPCSDAFAFLVTTSGGGKELKWATPEAEVSVNAAGGPAGAGEAILAGLATWNGVATSSFDFTYLGTTTSAAYGTNDGKNIVGFGPISTQGVLAQNTYWYSTATGELLDSDIRFNTSVSWSAAGGSTAYDVQNVATHELGHSLSLADLYGAGDSEKTMYGYAFKGETKKNTLSQDDIDGISYLYPAAAVETVPVTGDLDGDGKADLGYYTAVHGDWVWLRTTLGPLENRFGYAGTVPVTGDFDGDGRADYGVYNAQQGLWHLFKSTEGYFETQFGYPGTVPVVGDFDGDGRTDFGCYYAPLGKWYLYKSTEGFYETQFGYEGTVPVVGDFDGDGRSDFGCYYAQLGKWYLFGSTDGFFETQFGYVGTVPVVGDFDGDGRTDFGVNDPSSGDWYLFKSQEGFTQLNF